MKSIINRAAWLGAATAILIAGTAGIASADSAATTATTPPNDQTAAQPQAGATTTTTPAPKIQITKSQETKTKNQPVRRAERGTKNKL